MMVCSDLPAPDTPGCAVQCSLSSPQVTVMASGHSPIDRVNTPLRHNMTNMYTRRRRREQGAPGGRQYLSPGGAAAPASCSRRRSRRSRSRRPRCCRPAASCAAACGGSWTRTNQSSVTGLLTNHSSPGGQLDRVQRLGVVRGLRGDVGQQRDLETCH